MSELLLAHIVIAICNLLPGILIKTFGRTNPETGRTGWARYNTPKAHLNKETQAYANQYAGTAFMWAGLILLSIQIFSYVLFPGETSIYIMVAGTTLGYIPVIVLTEKALNREFDDEGNRRTDYKVY